MTPRAVIVEDFKLSHYVYVIVWDLLFLKDDFRHLNLARLPRYYDAGSS
jgi:hypothetical protein